LYEPDDGCFFSEPENSQPSDSTGYIAGAGVPMSILYLRFARLIQIERRMSEIIDVVSVNETDICTIQMQNHEKYECL
jgi:hypothetical protein